MNDQETIRLGVVVAGFGSPHGDDRAGWEVVERLGVRDLLCVAAERGDVAANRVRVVRVREGDAVDS